jgi:Uncharacterized conserved protein
VVKACKIFVLEKVQMKVVRSKEMVRIEKKSLSEDSSLAEKYMECAGEKIFKEIKNIFKKENIQNDPGSVLLLTGKGNNSGDAYVVGRLLLKEGFKVSALEVLFEGERTNLCEKNYQKFLASGGKILKDYQASLKNLSKDTIICDGLLGIGFKPPLSKDLKDLIESVNKLKNKSYSS